MATLKKTLRKLLEKTVTDARSVAEVGAQKALEQLAVHHHEPWGNMMPGERTFRNRLRAHGRQLGDIRDTKRGAQEITHLVAECAYQHWHRMLFARYLAESDLLVEPATGMAISLEECKELAADTGDDWIRLASSFAQSMLPQIFRDDNPTLSVMLPAETRSKLESLLNELPCEVFQADDSLGWVYQFWQTRNKKRINKAEIAIGADELPSVTQLFTEDYMVAFLLDNTLGAWWASRRLSSLDLNHATSEQELRKKVSLPSLPLDYLRFHKDEAGFSLGYDFQKQFPQRLSEFKLMDPCCGSGHFLVAAFLMLVPMRMELENLTAPEAIDAVIRQNLNGLEIDQRCVELAAFALALAAWRYPNSGGYRVLPQMNLACAGLAIANSKDEWTKLTQGNHNLRIALDWMYDAFAKAPLLGSLINPFESEAAKIVEADELYRALETALQVVDTEDSHEAGVTAQGLAKAAKLLSQQYSLIATNVPYRNSADLVPDLSGYFATHYPKSAIALETVFLQRCLEFCSSRGVVSVVVQQNWLNQPKYEDLREQLLRNCTFAMLARLGPRAFETISGEVVNVILLSLIKQNPSLDQSSSVAGQRKPSLIYGLDAASGKQAADKDLLVRTAPLVAVDQAKQLTNIGARISFDVADDSELLGTYAKSVQGIKTGDDPRFRHHFWELPTVTDQWSYFQSTVSATTYFGGLESIVYWGNEGNSLARKRGHSAWNTRGLAISQMSALPCALYLGGLFDSNMTAVVPLKKEYYEALVAYGMSNELSAEVRKVDTSIKPTNGIFKTIPIDFDRWEKVAKEKYASGVPEPFSKNPNQWIFHGDPSDSVAPLQVAMLRLLGYQWPAEYDPRVELSPEARFLVNRLNRFSELVDDDGIVCLPSLKGEPAAAKRLVQMLATAYGDMWSADKLHSLLSEVGFANRSVDDWLRDAFFVQHCDMFNHHPIIWHIWDGRLDGFHAFCNYHQLATPNGNGQRTLKKLIYTYLGDWIDRQRDEQKTGVEGADSRLAAAETLKQQLELILDGEPPFDIFVRWKSIQQQSLGWNPDVKDGVRINIRPFMYAKPLASRNATGCILRITPRISWDKDRGKEPIQPAVEYPWLWTWDGGQKDFAGSKVFDGNRWNALHYSNTFKRLARERQGVAEVAR